MTEAEEWKEWELESNGSDSSGGWNDVASDGSDIELSDSDDEEKGNSRKKRKLDKQAKLDAAAYVKPVVEAGTVLPAEVAESSADIISLVDDEAQDADTEEEDDDEDTEVAVPLITLPEMTAEQAAVELEGTTFADLATTKVSSLIVDLDGGVTDE